MKALTLIKPGAANTAFEVREVTIPKIQSGQALIKVEGFGLNFADVMARKGLYRDAPPLPSVLGYDVCGTVAEVSADVTHIKVGDRVAAMTRFGGYAEYAITDARACMKVDANINIAEATALATQYCTAYFSAAEMVNLHEGDKVLIHAAAGGVGTALIQYCQYKKCEIFATVGSDTKVEMLRNLGVNHVINYNKEQFDEVIMKQTLDKGVDVIFDSVGASYFKRGFKILASGGRIVGFGAADMSSANVLSQLKGAIGFGIYHPAQFLMTSKSVIGVNMLRIADDKPEVLKRCFTAVFDLYQKGIFRPVTGKIFPVSEISNAHEYLESRQSVGKVAVSW